MQIFRISSDHKKSARFLDNRRLSKQVLELYQIIRVCLAKLNLVDINSNYIKHPIVAHVYNNGKPYLIDTFNILESMNEEHIRRGGKRSVDFKNDIARLREIVYKEEYQKYFSYEMLPPFYVFGDCKVHGEDAFELYQTLLFNKWKKDKIPPRCGVKKGVDKRDTRLSN
ncbi:pyrimidine dimer DNA glycosylase/endonuclease V [Staphylococcus equorum]|uniref:Pyrimidine dimer DNA glycosylase/endonuclease V n=1 Tax=Staphylococcus equorum TaxID=246432 RepID=A0A9X4R1C5_9STAP|nr:pyrimidine dimer DNA glycosylase/endonuclease V [Staphylococcus equorum]MDG0843077.1 pyrimidine dimer DNA glycosylase/endonuclease V [Staphylococcus equorum]MDG0858971.1 pyrimidine dimer DNA glycosylase/endonuclease V [Staphylococcus equorum]